MNIVYFYSEVMGYTMAVIRRLIEEHGATVHVVYWDKNKRTPFVLPEIEGVYYYKRSEMPLLQLEALILKTRPELMYISGRMDKGYLKASQLARKQGTKIVSGFDAQWESNWKKKLIALGGKWLYKKYFDYIWVPGPFQYEFARKIGFSRNEIIWNLLSAETPLFEEIFKTHAETESFNKQFVFVGRFAEVKGIDVLIKAFLETKKIQNHPWKLLLIGNGPLENTIPKHEDIEVSDFLQPKELAQKTSRGGVFVLPSSYEPWGVVLHEYSIAGFPIICSDNCGAATTFVKDGYNGFIFQTNNISSLTSALLKMINNHDVQLKTMARKSNEVGKVVNPSISAAAFVSILKK